MTGITKAFAEGYQQLRGNAGALKDLALIDRFHPLQFDRGKSASIPGRRLFWFFVAIPFCITTSFAETAADASAGSGALEEIIVTAQRRSENLEKTPVAVLVLTQDALASRAIVTESDLQAAVPGLTVRATASSNDLNYAIRGQSVEAFTGSTPAVLPYVNEVQINQHGASAFFDLQSVQVLEGPQGTLFGRNATGGAVLFTTVKPGNELGGYVTARYGNYSTQQIEGAINVPLIDDKLLMRIAGIYEGHDGYQYNQYTNSNVGGTYRSGGRFSLTFKPTDGLSDTLVAQFSDTGGFSKALVAYSGFAPNSPLAAAAPIPGTLLYGPTLDAVFNFPGAWAAYLAAHPKAPAGGLYAYIAQQNAQGPFVVDDNAASPEHSQTIEVSNVTLYDIASDTQLKNIFGIGRSSVFDQNDYDGSSYGLDVQQNDFDTHHVSDELQLLGTTLDKQLKYVAGLYFSNDYSLFQAPALFAELLPLSPGAPSAHRGITRDKSYAGYTQGTYDLSQITGVNGLGFTLGVRDTSEKVSGQQPPDSDLYNYPGGENYLSQTFNKVSWQVGFQEQLNNDLLLYVVSRRSFRSGGVNVLSPPIAEPAAVGGAFFKPETATDVEIGAKYQGQIDTVPVRLNVAIYNQIVDDIQRSLYAFFTNAAGAGSIASLTVNVPQARIRGIESDGQISPTSWLNIGGSVTFTDAKFTDPYGTALNVTNIYGPFADTPRWTGTLYSELAMPLPADVGTLMIRGDAYTQSSFYFSSLNATVNPGTEIRPYTIANFRVGIDKIGGTKVSAAVILHNAFNRVYFIGGLAPENLIGVNTATPGDARTIMGEVHYKF